MLPVTRHCPSILLLAALAACQQRPAETAAPPVAPAPGAAPAPAAHTVAQQFSPVISGQWVSEAYLQAVARTRSPQAALAQAPAPASLQINAFGTRRDSTTIMASYGMHEGASLVLLLQPSADANSLPIKPSYVDEDNTSASLSYHLTARDTTLLLVRRSRKTGRVVATIPYRRTSRADAPDLETGIYRGVNALLVAGRYRGTDSLGRPVQAQFAPDGTVTGLPFRKYLVQVDFTGPNPGDALLTDVYTKQQQQFAASFGRDTLKLYSTHATVGIPPGGTDSTEYFVRGRLRYQLVRVRRP